MIEKISSLLGIAYRQEVAMHKAVDIIKSFFSADISFKQILSGLLALIECFCCLVFDTPVTPSGPELDLSGYELVFCDEFEGSTLDTDAWFYRGSANSRAGHNSPNQVSLRDGNLVITGEYREDGEHGAGWYAEDLCLREKYCKGYFEIRCICSPGTGFWSAFWIQADHPYDHYLSQGGVYGAEIDIFESSLYGDYILKSNKSSVISTVHCNGGDDDIENIDSCRLGKFKANNIYTEYNTYGVEWTDDEYIFYINGTETARTSFANGVSQVPEQVLVTLCLPEKMEHEKDYKTEFIVDYVKIYQKV